MGLKNFWPHQLVVRGRMMFSYVVLPIFTPRRPVHVKLALARSVWDPMKAHINLLWSFVFHWSVEGTYCRRIIDLHQRWRLWVSKFLKSNLHWACFSRIFICRRDFRLHSTRHNVFYDLCKARNYIIWFRFLYFLLAAPINKKHHLIHIIPCRWLCSELSHLG